jgi:4-amino-4-deoxy-L-arabinose transferase-like glycosyltransferase
VHPLLGRLTSVRATPIVAGTVVGFTLFSVITFISAGVFWDDGVYLITARALANGEGYRFLHLPGAPPAVHYPPGWPAILALAWKLFPTFPGNLGVFAFINVILAAVGAALACAYGIRRLALHPLLALAAVLLFALTLPVMVLDSVLFAEPAFLVLAILTIFAADRVADRGGWRAALLAGALAGMAMLVRSTGVVLVPAIVVALALAGRRREAAIAFAASLVLVLPWQIWSSLATAELAEPLRGNYGPYFPWLAGAVGEQGLGFLFGVARQNFASLLRSMAVVFFPEANRELRPLLVALLAAVCGLGLILTWHRARAFALFLVAYACLVMVWPYAPDRFAWGVWPLAGLVLAMGAHGAWSFARRRDLPALTRVSAWTALGVVGIAAGGLWFYSARGTSRGWVNVAQRGSDRRLMPVVDWVNRNTPPSAVIACDGEPLVHLYTGRKVVPVHVLSPDEYLAGTPLEQAAADLRALIVAGHADFVVLSAGAGELDAAPLLGAGTSFPRIVPLDTLPGGGVAFRVQWQE